MKDLWKIFFVFLLSGIIIASCSELKKDITSAPEISVHQEGILDPNSPNFHVILVENSPNGWQDCQQCHAADFTGGVVGEGCNITGCHISINVHVEGINDTTSANFHGKFIANNQIGLVACSMCHGVDFSGGIASPSCLDCHPALDVHMDGIIDQASENFHGKYIASNGWDLPECATCHASDYSGGLAAPSCLTCHTDENGPEACNTCHGDFNDPNLIAPPKDINGNFSTDSLGVGAHYQHLYANELGSDIDCSTCHNVPQHYLDIGHLDTDLPAEVILSKLAIVNIASNASYEHSTATCSNVYCHGNWEFLKDSSDYKFIYTSDKMVGNKNQVVFNKVDGTQGECGSCHGLPPEGHIPSAISNCGNVGCHIGIVDSDGNIMDREKHINGKKNVRGN